MNLTRLRVAPSRHRTSCSCCSSKVGAGRVQNQVYIRRRKLSFQEPCRPTRREAGGASRCQSKGQAKHKWCKIDINMYTHARVAQCVDRWRERKTERHFFGEEKTGYNALLLCRNLSLTCLFTIWFSEEMRPLASCSRRLSPTAISLALITAFSSAMHRQGVPERQKQK